MRKPDRAADFNWPADMLITCLDLTDMDSLAAAKEAAEASFGAADAPVDNAGRAYRGTETCTPKQTRNSFETNLSAPWKPCACFCRACRTQQGVIVNVTRIDGRMTFPFYGYYSAAKYALESISQELWHDLYPSQVRVKVVEPGFTQTTFAETGLAMGGTGLPFYREKNPALDGTAHAGQHGDSAGGGLPS